MRGLPGDSGSEEYPIMPNKSIERDTCYATLHKCPSCSALKGDPTMKTSVTIILSVVILFLFGFSSLSKEPGVEPSTSQPCGEPLQSLELDGIKGNLYRRSGMYNTNAPVLRFLAFLSLHPHTGVFLPRRESFLHFAPHTPGRRIRPRSRKSPRIVVKALATDSGR
jgi:hypothetical protein